MRIALPENRVRATFKTGYGRAHTTLPAALSRNRRPRRIGGETSARLRRTSRKALPQAPRWERNGFSSTTRKQKVNSMNSALKQTIIAMATAALSVTAGCKTDSGPTASEATTGSEKTSTMAAEASCGEGSCSAAKKGDASEASCGEGSCGADKKGDASEASCGEGSCG